MQPYTWDIKYMRTNIIIDDNLMNLALKISGLKTKKAVVEEALKLLVLVKQQAKLKTLQGKLVWKGNLDKLRTTR